jgi:hypothetical protein
VGLQSKWTGVPGRCEGGDQLPNPRAERRRLTHDLLGKARKMIGGTRFEGEQVPDLRVFRARGLHHTQCVGVGSRLRIVLYFGKKYWLHFGGFSVDVAHLGFSASSSI